MAEPGIGHYRFLVFCPGFSKYSKYLVRVARTCSVTAPFFYMEKTFQDTTPKQDAIQSRTGKHR
jgi:hypothetical protein